MRQISTVLLLAALGTGIASAPEAAEAFRQLKSPEIKARFEGMEFTDEVHWAYVFERSGRLASFSMSKKSAGKWRVGKDELCLDRERTGQRCYQVWASGKSIQLREAGNDITEDGILQKPSARK